MSEQNIKVKNLRMEIGCNFTCLKAVLKYNVDEKEVTQLSVEHVLLEDYEKIKEICQKTNKAILHVRDEKLKDLCNFKIKYCSDIEIPIKDVMSESDIPSLQIHRPNPPFIIGDPFPGSGVWYSDNNGDYIDPGPSC